MRMTLEERIAALQKEHDESLAREWPFWLFSPPGMPPLPFMIQIVPPFIQKPRKSYILKNVGLDGRTIIVGPRTAERIIIEDP